MMRRGWLGLSVFLILVAIGGSVQAAPARLERLTIASDGADTRLALVLSDARPYRLFTLSAPDRLVVDIEKSRLGASALPLPAGAGVIRQVRVANRTDGSVRVVLDLAARAEPRGVVRRVAGAAASEIDITLSTTAPAARPPEASVPVMAEKAPAPAALPAEKPAAKAPAVSAVPMGKPARQAAVAKDTRAAPAKPASAAAEPPLIGRDIVIAVDAGHGGKDPGAHGPRGVREKDVTLKISRLLLERINAEPGMRGVLTRDRDEFVPLRERMERARRAKADLFVSVHADAVRNRSVRGASVYVLNEKGATDEAARRLAARENSADLIGGVSLGNKDRTLASVLLDLSQNASIGSSIEVADSILAELARVGTVRKQRVMQAPFMVLKSPDVPSVLIETAYISNPDEERRLDSHAYRARLAGALLAGVRGYFYRNPPQGTLVAELSRRRDAGAITHVTRRGESLSTIASRYNTSVRRIRDANRLQGDRVIVGQVLRIPVTHES